VLVSVRECKCGGFAVRGVWRWEVGPTREERKEKKGLDPRLVVGPEMPHSLIQWLNEGA
jgi:hypothetical protein